MQVIEKKGSPLHPLGTPTLDLGLNSAMKKGRRSDVDAMSTVAWVRYLQYLSHSKSSYALGRLIEGDAYWRTQEGISYHRNKWSKYQKGQHRPRATLVKSADNLFPGSAQVINSTLWVILKNIPANQNEISKIESILSAEVKITIEKWRNCFRNGRNPGIRRLAHKLEKIHNLDALAAIMLMCQASYLSNRGEDAFEWSRYIYRYLAINAEFFHISGIKQEIFEKINEVLLCKIQYNNLRYIYPFPRYSILYYYLMEAIRKIKNLDYSNINTEKIIFHARKALNEDYGWDLKVAFNPILEFINQPSVNDELFEDLVRMRNNFDYAWGKLIKGEIQKEPPDINFPLNI